MKRLLTGLVLTFFVAAPAMAAEDSPFYAGGLLGSSSIASSSSTAIGGLVGYTLSGIKLGAMRTLAIEAQYTSLGSISYSDRFAGVGVDAVGHFPLTSAPNLSVFGKLGVNNISGNFRCTPTCSYTTSSGLVPDFGFGGQYKFTRDFSLRVGYHYYDSDLSTVYAAALFRF